MQEQPQQPGLQKTDRRNKSIFRARKRNSVARGVLYKEDTYILGGILIYCGILLPELVNLGIPDDYVRLAWIAFAITLPCTVGFFLVRFAKTSKSDSNYGSIHASLANLAELGILITTTGLFFHVWDVVGWIFSVFGAMISFGYGYYRLGIYNKKDTDDTLHKGEHHE